MALYTEKTYNEVMNPLKNYAGDNSYVKGYTNALQNGGDQYEYAKNYKAYKNALEAGKANDNDNLFTKIGDFFVGRDLDKTKADYADAKLKQYNDYFEQNGYDKNILPYYFDSGDYKNIIDSAKTEYNPDAGRYMNGGLIGAMVNPFTQVGKMGIDAVTNLAGGQTKERDWLSDLGAIGESALNLATGGGTNILKDLGKGAIKNIARDAAVSGVGAALNTVTQNGAKDFDLGNTLSDAAFGGVAGAALGGALRGLGKIGNKLSNVAKNNRVKIAGNGVANLYSWDGNPVSANGVSYLDALKNSGLDPTDNVVDYTRVSNILQGKKLPEDLATNTKALDQLTGKVNNFVSSLGGDTQNITKPGLVKYSGDAAAQRLYDALSKINTIPSNGASYTVLAYPGLSRNKFGQEIQGALDLAKDWKGTGSKIGNKLANSTIGKATSGAINKLSNSTVYSKTKDILSTNAGKALAGVGGGFLLSKLLNGGNAQNNKFSDDELEMLAEYYYNNYGGQ